MVQIEEIELPDGKHMREVNLDGYRYFGGLQFDSIMNREMKEKVKSEYIRRVKKLLRSELNGENVIIGMNVWAVGVIEVLKELKSIDIKTRKLMTMNGGLHPKGNVGRLYLAREKGGRGLVSSEECVNVEL